MIIAEAIRWASLVLFASVGVWFARVVGHFDKRSPRRPLLAVLLVLSLAAGVASLVSVVTDPLIVEWRYLVAMVLAVLAGLLFRAALSATRNKSLSLAFSRATAPALVESGPYRYVRHPLYTAYVIFWLACALLSGSTLVAALVALIVCLYAAAARMEEQDIMRSPLAPAYADYRTRTGMLLPNPFRSAGGSKD